MNTLHRWILSGLIVYSVGGCAGSESYPDPAPQTKEAQRRAAALERRDRAAHAICKETYGRDAVVLWTAAGDMVCRRARPANIL